jgi:hypothetical protein
LVGQFLQRWPGLADLVSLTCVVCEVYIVLRLTFSFSLLLELILIDNNTITGDTTLVCEEWRRLDHFIADCNELINCSCCTLCCDDDSGPCHNDEDLLAEFDPVWEEAYQRRDYIFSEYGSPATRFGQVHPDVTWVWYLFYIIVLMTVI